MRSPPLDREPSIDCKHFRPLLFTPHQPDTLISQSVVALGDTCALMRVPDEILLLIFFELAPNILAPTEISTPSGPMLRSTGDHSFPTNYSHVCQRWMNAIQCAPTLWNKLVFFVDEGLGELRTLDSTISYPDLLDVERCCLHLERCKDLPSDIKFTRLRRNAPVVGLLLRHCER
ncbi:hypothetical protein BDV98DRAFT_316360 [Pterulicium gracile]|uniref:Uncharacterized protein n=1 Tax=Pterulicium gracile TaxID=1884261 RepID=A0A5C3R143_9AGAR|nr:hypothetical protein BDV98DRAFT_316360 [Pterula gracilis]